MNLFKTLLIVHPKSITMKQRSELIKNFIGYMSSVHLE